MLLESAFHWLFCLKFSFKLVPFSRVMQENKSGVFSEDYVQCVRRSLGCRYSWHTYCLLFVIIVYYAIGSTLIILFLVSHFNFLFVPCGRLSWLPVSFLLHVKRPLSYRIVSCHYQFFLVFMLPQAKHSGDIMFHHVPLSAP